MCYMNCEFENRKGECMRPRTKAPCPCDMTEEELKTAREDAEDAYIESLERREDR